MKPDLTLKFTLLSAGSWINWPPNTPSSTTTFKDVSEQLTYYTQPFLVVPHEQYAQQNLSEVSYCLLRTPWSIFSVLAGLFLLQPSGILRVFGTKWTKVGAAEFPFTVLTEGLMLFFCTEKNLSLWQKNILFSILEKNWQDIPEKENPSLLALPILTAKQGNDTRAMSIHHLEYKQKPRKTDPSEGQRGKCCLTKSSICSKSTIFAAYITQEQGLLIHH